MSPVFLAPMAGVTDKPFRQMVRLFGNQTLFTEMVASESLWRNHPVTRKMMSLQDEHHVIVQIVGIDVKALVYAAQMAESFGAIGVDINMGCPVKKLISNGSGAALLKMPMLAAHLVEEIKKNVSVPVSVKTRIGWDSRSVNILEFAKTLESAGADFISVHARTKEEGYSGLAHYEVVQQVKENLHIPVYVNGNIIDQASFQKAIHLTQCDGALVGRGALGKPWILTEIETGQKPRINLAELVCHHIDLLLNYYGKHGIYIARKHIAWYMQGQKNVAEFCQKVYAETDVDKIKRMIHLLIEENT